MLLRRILEGMLADECYEQAKNEGCKVEVVWQDGDSCAAKSISQHHPTGNGPIYTRDGSSVWDELGQRTVVRLIIRLCINTGFQTDHPSRRTITVVRLDRRTAVIVRLDG